MIRHPNSDLQTKHTVSLLIVISAGLVLLILAAFEPLRHNDFITYDDDFYITRNHNIQSGITCESVIWAFTSGYQANWHPLTWLSHMADIELFGLHPLGHHLHNLFLHTLSTILLFWLLYKMTGAIWPSAFAAMCFGIHPLRVESVTWAAERKDVLAALFWMLTTAAYLYYIKRGGVFRYLLVVLCFALGLMSKPMLVTLPVILLLLDIWPLRRFDQNKLSRVMEKIPLLILVLGSCIVTYLVQQKSGTVDVRSLPIHHVTNALANYFGYLGKIVWPVNLAVLYPYSDKGFVWWKPIVLFFVLAVCVGFSILRFRKQPWLAIGWFWYMIALIPVIGLVQVGIQAAADRYTYLPSIGIFIIVAWSAAEISARWRLQKIILGTLIGLAAIAMGAGTRIQLTRWKDSATLFTHTLSVTQDNFMMHHNLGWFLLQQNKYDQAEDQFNKSLQIRPDFPSAHTSLAAILIIRQQFDEAMLHLQIAIKIEPDNSSAHFNMGLIFEARRLFDQAIDAFEKAVHYNPTNSEAFNHLGGLKIKKGLLDQAEECFRQSLRTVPDDADTYYNLAMVLRMQDRIEESIGCYRKTLQLKPNFIMALNNMAWILATTPDQKIQNPAESLQLALKLCQLTQFNEPVFLDTLAAAYAASGRFNEAQETIRKALNLAQTSGPDDMIEELSKHLHLYQASKPYLDPPPKQ